MSDHPPDTRAVELAIGPLPPAAILDRALCAQADPEAWFPEKGQNGARTRTAKAICGRCPVRAGCLDWALGRGELYGIWGGLTSGERRRLRSTAA